MSTDNLIGVHALVWAGGSTPDEVQTAVDSTARSGYDLLEMSLHDLDHLDIAAAGAALQAREVAVVCSRGLDFDADVSSDDLAVVSRGETLLMQSLDATEKLGATILTGALYSALGKYARRMTPSGRDNAVRVLRTLAREAHGRGLSIGLEVCNRYETNVVNTAAEALRLADDIGEDNVFIHLDTYHMNIEESDLVNPVLTVGDRLGYVHLGESHRGYLGTGSVNFQSFFGALEKINYQGPITFESFSSAVVSESLSNNLAVWRNMWKDGHDLAIHARHFIENCLSSAESAADGD